jgi:hypothetical protein
MLKWRRDCPLLGRDTFMTGQDITWWESNWDDEESRFLAFSLHDWCAATASKQADDDSIVWRPFCCEGAALPVSPCAIPSAFVYQLPVQAFETREERN